MDYGKTTLTAASFGTVGSIAVGSYLLVFATMFAVIAVASGIRLFWRRDKALSDR